MSQYGKNLRVDGFELYWMKRILERHSSEFTLADRIITGFCIQYHTFMPASAASVQERHDAYLATWQRYWNGDLEAIRQRVREEANRSTQDEPNSGRGRIRLGFYLFIISAIFASVLLMTVR